MLFKKNGSTCIIVQTEKARKVRVDREYEHVLSIFIHLLVLSYMKHISENIYIKPKSCKCCIKQICTSFSRFVETLVRAGRRFLYLIYSSNNLMHFHKFVSKCSCISLIYYAISNIK